MKRTYLILSSGVSRRLMGGLALVVWIAAVAMAAEKAPTAQDPPSPEGIAFFEKKIRPLLVKHCYSCHSAGAKKLRGELRLDTRAGVLKGGASGPAVVPGDPARSLLIRAVRHADDVPPMPPKGKLPAAGVDDLEAWVRMGAPDPRTGAPVAKPLDLARAREFWSFRPVRDPPVPAVKDAGWPLTPVDRFVLARLEEEGLRPAPP